MAIPLALALAFEFPLCPMAGMLGIPCPGCGLTRATLALLRGDVATAYRFHPLVFVLAPLYIGALGAAAWEFVSGPSGRPPRFDLTSRRATLAATALLVLVLGVWGARFLGLFGGPAPVKSFGNWLAMAPN